MRSALRCTLAALALAAVASCTESATVSPREAKSSLALLPRFTDEATRSAATLAEGGVQFDHVRIVIVRPASDTLKDTSVVFGPTSSALTLELAVNAVPDEALKAALHFTQGTGAAATVMFSGTADVKTVAPTQAPTTTPSVVTMKYAGPGATATKVTMTPGTGVYAANTSTQFTAVALDGSTVLPNTPLIWSVSDPTIATISATGLLTPVAARGTLRVRAFTPGGVADSATVTLAPPAIGLRVVQGAGQRAVAGSVLPIPVIIEAIAADGESAPPAGMTATFTASPGAQISPATVAFDASGRAQATMKLGSTGGTTYIYTVSAGGFSLSWGATADVGTPTHFVPSGPTSLTLTAGVIPSPIPTLRLADANESSVPGQFVKVTIQQNGSNVIAPFTVPVDSIGLLEVYKVAPTIAGDYSIIVEAATASGVPPITYSVRILAGPAAKLGFTQQPPGGVAANQTITPAIAVAVQDQFGNTVTTATGSISLSRDPGGPTSWALAGTTSVSLVNGVAVFSNLQVTTSVSQTQVRLQAIGAGLAAMLSQAFNITP